MGAGVSTQVAEKVGPSTEADLKAALTELSQADKDKVIAALQASTTKAPTAESPLAEAPAAEAPATEAPAAEAPVEDAAEASAARAPAELTDEEIEERKKSVAAANAAAYERARKTGSFFGKGDLEKLRKKQEEWAREVLEARKLESVPSWVQGPCPSAECLAQGTPNEPPDSTPWEELVQGIDEGLAAFALDSREIDPIADGFEVPATMKFEPVDADGVPCCWCNWPGTSASKGVIFFIHGGGGFLEHIFPTFAARVSCASGLRVLSVDYMLAPDPPVKAAVDDMVKAYLWLTKTTPPEQVAMYGSSFGGWAVFATLQALLQQDKKPACAVSESPILPQCGLSFGAMWEFIAGSRGWHGRLAPDAKITIKEIKDDPFYNIVEGQLSGLPPLYIGVGSLESVERQIKPAKVLAEACKNAGVQVELEVVRNCRHVPGCRAYVVPENTSFLERIAAFMNKCLAGDSAK
eukprot:TRINITY_DN17974_c0_g1_i1.p1 TRINITY_DN17974_c0_g1~~TRINITY_DN17974_c0_g1_i1.p1  ORF type:complete len:466 (+),score=83.10 TRINITY_DN17974_c0_g1_i1:71-1468(+)